jgi:hypothetical protein|tara:strand:+ start:257 stop:493 length:237 start_codon:yes stop_codon:yes gene_type:complete
MRRGLLERAFPRKKPKAKTKQQYIPEANHPWVEVDWATPYKEITGSEMKKKKFRQPPPLTEQQKLDVLNRINKIKSRI